eukprot:2669433-Prymnesium_polylepis.1
MVRLLIESVVAELCRHGGPQRRSSAVVRVRNGRSQLQHGEHAAPLRATRRERHGADRGSSVERRGHRPVLEARRRAEEERLRLAVKDRPRRQHPERFVRRGARMSGGTRAHDVRRELGHAARRRRPSVRCDAARRRWRF